MITLNAYGEERITRLDVYFTGSLSLVSLILIFNIFLRSINLVYTAILLALGSLIHANKYDSEKKFLRNLWILGGFSTIFYPLIDYFFEAELGLVTYLTNDPKIFVTPMYVIFYWVFGVLLFGYCYYRVYNLANKRLIAGFVTGLFAAASATFIENLFNAMGFYRNTPSHCMIGYVPVYVPFGYLIVFSFMPFYLRHRAICGLLLYFFTGLSWYLFYHIVSLFVLLI